MMDIARTDLLLSIRRTLVPIIVGFVLARGARWGFDIPPNDLTGVIESIVTGVYYTLVRLAETYWPQIGILLGGRSQPEYPVHW